MSVFTTVSSEQLRIWLSTYPLGELLDLQGIASGITNTNYFVTTTTGRYVLTLFEEHSAEELPYFIDLMTHLAERNVPCPHPIANLDGQALSTLEGKPAALVSCLKGRSLEEPAPIHCAEIGHVLAKMHLAGADFTLQTVNSRGAAWRSATASKVAPFLNTEDREMLEQVFAIEGSLGLNSLPHGVIHADLFRDNVLFDGDTLGGLIDFYYACNDVLLYDVAIAVNDWCVQGDGTLDVTRSEALLQAYNAVRPLTGAEHAAWPGLLCIAALRFWLSRLNDFHFPHAGELTHAKDPQHFQRILKKRISSHLITV
ncbi:MAG: homoserine kinase [Methylophilaceae bacterium]